MVDCGSKTTNMTAVQQPIPKRTIKRAATSANINSVERMTGDISHASEIFCSAYESYLRLSELQELWSTTHFPDWESELIVKPALQALEITFRFISIVLSDARPYVNHREWSRRLETLARDQVALIALMCEQDETRGGPPIVDLMGSCGEVKLTRSATEVWKLSGGGCSKHTVVSHGSAYSLLPRLATWQKSEDISLRIFDLIESSMRRCTYTLGLGENNLAGKPNLDYDAVCRPNDLHALKKYALDHVNNYENQILFTIHQILESWIFSAKKILIRIRERIDMKEYSKAAEDCWILEKIWKLLEGIENLHSLMDPNDFLHLKTQLGLKSSTENDTFCFRSRGLVEITKMSKDLRDTVPEILGVEVDPMGGPRIHEAAMGVYKERRSFEKVHLLQAFQGVESSVKGFYFNYKQLLVVMMGSLEAKTASGGLVGMFPSDMLSQLFLEPTYYPSLDGAKTFIGNIWERDHTGTD